LSVKETGRPGLSINAAEVENAALQSKNAWGAWSTKPGNSAALHSAPTPHPTIQRVERSTLVIPSTSFIAADEAEPFILLDHPHLIRKRRSVWQTGTMGVNPVNQRLRMDPQMPRVPAEIHAIDRPAHRLLAPVLGIARLLWLRGLFAPAALTPIALAARSIEPDLALVFGCLTVWTCFHPSILPKPLIFDPPRETKHGCIREWGQKG
jgi:hypothetical protein